VCMCVCMCIDIYICECIYKKDCTCKSAVRPGTSVVGGTSVCACVCMYIDVYMCKCIYRVAKTHRMPYLHRSFSAKEPYNLWLFCGK